MRAVDWTGLACRAIWALALVIAGIGIGASIMAATMGGAA